MAKIIHRLLALIATGTDRERVKYVEFLKEENEILRAQISGPMHTTPEEQRLRVQLGGKPCMGEDQASCSRVGAVRSYWVKYRLLAELRCDSGRHGRMPHCRDMKDKGSDRSH